jgi:DNA-binding response OmpR family regulator
VSEPLRRRAIVDGEERRLTRQEWGLLIALWSRRGRTVEPSLLEEALYPPPQDRPAQFGNLLKVVVFRLRKKLAGTPLVIETVYGEGYHLVQSAAVPPGRLEAAADYP